MKYGSWDMEHDGQNFLSFRAIFCPFTLLTPQKIKILKKWKNAWRYYHFTKMYQKPWSYATLYLHFSLWAIFCHFTPPPLPPLTAKKIKMKKKKTPGDIIILHRCTKNYDLMTYSSWDITRGGWTDGWKKWHIEVGSTPRSTFSPYFNPWYSIWLFHDQKTNLFPCFLCLIC